MLESRPGTASSQACCQRAKENTGGDGGEVGRCETDQTMDVRNVLLVEAKRKEKEEEEEWRRACENGTLGKALVFWNEKVFSV